MTRRHRHRLAAAGIAVLAALSLAAASCGGDDSANEPAPTVPPGALVVLAQPGLRLDKSEYTATAGDVVIAYVQEDTQRHTLVVKDPNGVIIGDKLDVVSKGDVDYDTYTLTPGTYEIYCDVPGHGSMKATLIVT